jgi:hypothetical protein
MKKIIISILVCLLVSGGTAVLGYKYNDYQEEKASKLAEVERITKEKEEETQWNKEKEEYNKKLAEIKAMDKGNNEIVDVKTIKDFLGRSRDVQKFISHDYGFSFEYILEDVEGQVEHVFDDGNEPNADFSKLPKAEKYEAKIIRCKKLIKEKTTVAKLIEEKCLFYFELLPSVKYVNPSSDLKTMEVDLGKRNDLTSYYGSNSKIISFSPTGQASDEQENIPRYISYKKKNNDRCPDSDDKYYEFFKDDLAFNYQYSTFYRGAAYTYTGEFRDLEVRYLSSMIKNSFRFFK